MKQKEYDVIVIGSGCGMNIVEEALAMGHKVALVDKGPLGGTCPNNGCIPSKMLVFPADHIMEIHEASRFGIKTDIKSIDFAAIMERARTWPKNNQAEMRHGISHAEGLDFYKTEGHFVDEFTLEAGGKRIRGEKIFIASGSRPAIPPIKGLADTGYLTNETVLELR